jgi:hypothetical protein
MGATDAFELSQHTRPQCSGAISSPPAGEDWPRFLHVGVNSSLPRLGTYTRQRGPVTYITSGAA